MEFPEENFGPETVELMGRALTEAWSEIRDNTVFPTHEAEIEAQQTAVDRVMHAVTTGERDPERLKAIVIGAVYA